MPAAVRRGRRSWRQQSRSQVDVSHSPVHQTNQRSLSSLSRFARSCCFQHLRRGLMPRAVLLPWFKPPAHLPASRFGNAISTLSKFLISTVSTIRTPGCYHWLGKIRAGVSLEIVSMSLFIGRRSSGTRNKETPPVVLWLLLRLDRARVQYQLRVLHGA